MRLMADEETTPAAGQPAASPAATETPAPSPEATPPEGAQAVPEGQQPAATPAAEQEQGGSKRDTKAERRIGKLTHRAKAAEETVTSLQAENTALQQQLSGLTVPTEEESGYDTAQHTAAMVKHATVEANVQGRVDANTREIARVQQAQQAQIVAEVTDKVQAFSAKTPDYSQSVSKIANLPNLAGSVMQLENTPEVFYALSKDLNLAVALERMPANRRLIELGRISAEVTVKPANISGAPPPVDSAQGGTASSDKALDSMSMGEFDAWHDKHYGEQA